MIELYTTTVSGRKKVEIQPHVYDITVKSASFGCKAFAPSWSLVMDYKAGRLTDEAYTKRYLSMLENSQKMFPAAWAWLKSLDIIYASCYCKPGVFCHRVLFAKYLELKGWAIYKGEVS